MRFCTSPKQLNISQEYVCSVSDMEDVLLIGLYWVPTWLSGARYGPGSSAAHGISIISTRLHERGFNCGTSLALQIDSLAKFGAQCIPRKIMRPSCRG